MQEQLIIPGVFKFYRIPRNSNASSGITDGQTNGCKRMRNPIETSTTEQIFLYMSEIFEFYEFAETLDADGRITTTREIRASENF